MEQIKGTPFEAYYVDHTAAIWPQAAGGIPFNACEFQSNDNLIRLTDDPDVLDPLRFLRAREVVHFQRFGEGLSIVQDQLNSKNYYYFNPAFK